MPCRSFPCSFFFAFQPKPQNNDGKSHPREVKDAISKGMQIGRAFAPPLSHQSIIRCGAQTPSVVEAKKRGGGWGGRMSQLAKTPRGRNPTNQ
uniref:Uncharacterized protein n=1 Tax=Globodera rostochiensis TaxID=31243 RepID=A0A914HEZ3_GLORO